MNMTKGPSLQETVAQTEDIKAENAERLSNGKGNDYQENYQKCKDVDAGWAWVVLAAETTLFCIFGSSLKSMGVFLNGFIDEYGASSSITALIPGILQGTYSVASLPVLTIGLCFLSTRQCVIFTDILSAVAYIAGSFAKNIQTLLFTHGVMLGIAFSFVHGPLMYQNGMYFVERRNLAQAITVAGFSFGGLFFPPFYTYLIESYGLKGGMLISAGIQLHVIAFALLLRPKTSSIQIHKIAKSNQDIQEHDTYPSEHNRTSKFPDQLKNDLNKPLIFVHRQRSLSESYPCSYRPKFSSDMGTYSCTEVNLHRQQHVSSHSFVDRLSHSNIARVIGQGDMVSMSMSELHEKEIRHDSSSNSGISKCTERLKLMVDCSILNRGFMRIYFFVYSVDSIGSAYIVVFIAPFARDMNMSPEKVAILVSLVNTFDFIGRLSSGIITDRKILRNHHSVILTLCITTLCLALSPLYTEFWHLIALATIGGLCAGGIFAMTPSILADFLGVENFRAAMGILVLGQGVTLGLSAPFIGFLRDLTGTYIASFYFMAACEMLSVVIFVVGLLIWRKSYNITNGLSYSVGKLTSS